MAGENTKRGGELLELIQGGKDFDAHQESEDSLLQALEMEHGKPGKEGGEKNGEKEPGKKEGEPTAEPQPGELKKNEDGSFTMTVEGEETDQEKARAAATAATGKTEDQKRAEALTALNTQFQELAKKYPELEKLIPEDLKEKGVQGVFDRLTELQGRKPAKEEREDELPMQATNDPRVKQFVAQEVTRRLQAAGVEKIPQTEKEWDQLWDDNPGAARRLERKIDEVQREVEHNVNATVTEIARTPKHNAAVIDADWKQIQAEAKTAGIKVTEEEFVEFARKELKHPVVSETRHGVERLRPNGLLERWRQVNFHTILQGVRLSAESSTRRQTVEDLNKPKREGATVLGATAQGSMRGKREVRIDPTNERDLDGLPEETLEKMYDRT